MLTQAWTQLRPHELQSQMWRSKAKRLAAVCGRGSGKTELARRRVVRFLPVLKPWPDPIYLYALPTIGQARRIGWEKTLPLIPHEWIAKKNESRLTITTIFGSQLRFVGTDAAERVEGDQIDGIVIDERSDHWPGIMKTFTPMLTHRDAWMWQIGVPKRFGPGAREFKATWEAYNEDESGRSEAYTWSSRTILSESQLADASNDLDTKDFNEQYDAIWESASGLVYYGFHDVLNVRESSYNKQKMLMVGSDFNVDPMAWVVGQMQDDGSIDIIDEVWRHNTNTAATLDYLIERYPDHDSGWVFFGDAAGRARKTSASTTDYLLIANDTRFKKAKVFYPNANPPVKDRLAAMNQQFCAASKVRRLFVNPRCRYLKKDLESLSFKPGTTDIDKSHPDAGHITDALGYVIHKLRPVLLEMNEVPQVEIS
jgi:hypothetical protein